MKALKYALLGWAFATLPAQVLAADFPNKPVRIIVPFSPGSGADSTSRFFGEQLSRELGQSFIVENRPGASGAIAVNTVVNAPADGYAMLMASNSLISVNPFFMANLSYDPIKDLKPIAGITRGQSVIVVSNESPIKTLPDLIAAAKNSKQPLNSGTYSAGYRLAVEQLAGQAGVRFSNVSYKGAGQVVTDVIGKQLDFATLSFNGVSKLVQDGKLRALAISGDRRHPEFPTLPTVMESGFPNFTHYTWTSFYVRADTPDDVSKRLADAMQKILATQASKDYAEKTQVELMPLTPQAMKKFQLEELDLHRRVARKAGIQPQ